MNLGRSWLSLRRWTYRLVKRSPMARTIAERLFALQRRVKERFGPRGEPVPPPVGLAATTAVDLRPVASAESVTRRLPLCPPGQEHPRFEREASETLPASAVAVLPGGRVCSSSGSAVITADNRLVPSLAYELHPTEERYAAAPQRHPLLDADQLPAPKQLPGRVAALSAPGGAGYYHWLVDLLPRLQMLEWAGFELDSIDTFVVNLAVADFQHDTLARFGIGTDRIVTSQRHPHIQAEELVAPELPGGFGRPPSWVVGFLRERLGTTGQPDRRVYVSRRRAGHRQLRNSDEVEAVVRNHRFDVVELEAMSFTDQLAMLGSTTALCGTHGAGLTNIALCPAGGVVVSLMSPHDVSHVYWTLANQCDWRFAYVLAPGEILDRPDFDRVRYGSEDLTIEPEGLDLLLANALDGGSAT